MTFEPPPFVANHPFLFYIRDNRSNMVVFVGRLKQVTPPVKDEL